MSTWTRRRALHGTAALSFLPLLFSHKTVADEPRRPKFTADGARALQADPPIAATALKAPRPLVHTTDLFRPHDDPDDHWDLATAYAMTFRGDLDLMGILTDNPENLPSLYKNACSPDVAAVAQLNYLTDRAVPVTTGTIWPSKPGEKVREDNLPKDLNGVNMLLEILRRSSLPVAITVVGSCQDVAIAGKKEPRLFAAKCAGIYLNAGCGNQDPTLQRKDGEVEWNVHLNRGAYASIFELPCPVYWLPCFNTFANTAVPGEYGTNWNFQQKDVLSHLSPRAQVYFAYVLSKGSGVNWLTYLLDSQNKSTAEKYYDEVRGMYSTASFIHAAGKTVTSEGEIVSLEAAGKSAVYEFLPIDVRCDETGITDWQTAKASTDRYIFHVRDMDKYASAMAKALRSMLLALA
jgi:hypothetical protein